MSKSELRNKYKLIRHNIIDKQSKSNSIFNSVIKDENVISAKTILLYMSLSDEVNTFKYIDYFSDKVIGIPKVVNNDIKFYQIRSLDDTSIGAYNILEPNTLNEITDYSDSVIIVPGIVFDKYGYRIGYGKGFYDRFLSDKDIYSIGLCFDECLVDLIFHESHDIKLSKVITDKKKIIF